MNEIKIYTLEEVKGILKVTQRTLYNYIKEGHLKATKIGNTWRVTHEELDRFTKIGFSRRKQQ